MYLHLQNFCCWEDKAFHFPDNGSILISSPSGSGKTSIIRGIIFALFGVGDKIIMHGKRSCTVEFQIKELHILRKKGPGRLIVNKQFEDQEGQAIINKYFDNELFYLQQGGKNSFVTLSASEKLLYLEKIIFQHIPILNIKNNLKQEIKTFENNLLIKKSEFDTIASLVSSIQMPSHIMQHNFSIDYFKNLKEKHTSNISILNKLRTNLNSLQSIKVHIKQLNDIIISLKDTKTRYTLEKNEYETYISSIQIHDIAKYENHLNYLLKKDKLEHAYQELSDKKLSYSTIVKTEYDTIEHKIKNLELDMEKYWYTTEYDAEIKRIETLQSKTHQLLIVQKELKNMTSPEKVDIDIDFVNKQINEYSRILDEINRSYECPKCSTTLKLQNHVLIENPHMISKSDCIRILSELDEQKTKYTEYKVSYDKYIQQYTYIKQKIELLEKDIKNDQNREEKTEKTLNDLKRELVELTSKNQILDTYYDDLEKCITKYDILKNDCIELEKKYTILREEVDSLYSDEKWTITEVQQLISDLKMNISMVNTYTDLLNKVIKNINITTQEIDKNIVLKEQKTNEYEVILKNIECIKYSDTELEKSIDELENEIKFQIELQKYEESKKLLENYNIKKIQINNEVKQLETQLVNHMKLKEKISEAESIALTNLIQTINTNLQLYLDFFFEKEPIQVILSTFKMVKDTKKTQLNITVNYKGNQIDLINLSGGEYDRVVLAFTLTFAELTQSPILLLDECVSSLDQENAEMVFDCIKSYCKNKIVIIVAHQIVTGMFDEILKLI